MHTTDETFETIDMTETRSPAEHARTLLHEYFGHNEFRPLQREIIESVLQKRDNFVLMPTGGGKSICYQLPGIMQSGLTIVVSPLIALMKDQVDALIANGINATYINSSLDPSEVDQRRSDIASGKIKLLYVAPERLLLSGFLQFLDRQQISLIAIDEAHCISVWGHDFRDDYRGLSQLRDRWPNVPIIAMTATATKQVEEDIIQQLKFRPNAQRWVASFDRPNLFYSVKPKSGLDDVLDFVQARKNEAGIIYCFSRNQAEAMALAITKSGYKALPYHAGLDRDLRTRNQDKFIRGEVNIVCATIAFGMGIDKPDIRYVIHYDLPKSVSGYYQETGRAGRDGLNSECLLLFSIGDKVKQQKFAYEKETPQERAKALRDIDDIVSFAELSSCRRAYLLQHFGEDYPSDNCGSCDNCTSTTKAEVVDATKIAQMFLSCVVRVREGFGMTHVIDVLRGSESQKIQDFRHHQLTTYAIGKDISKKDWTHYGRELVRNGYIVQDHLQHSVLRVTKRGWDVLKNGAKVQLVSPVREKKLEKVQRTSTFIELPPLNKELLKELKDLRQSIATNLDIAPHNVFDEPTLYNMALELPTSARDLKNIEGISERKARDYGREFVTAVQRFVEAHPGVQRFESGRKISSGELSMHYFKSGMTLEEIARDRDLAEGTILGHLAPYIVTGVIDNVDSLVPPDRMKHLIEVIKKDGPELGKVMEAHPDQFGYAELRVANAWMQRNGSM
jgi:ATP-dependent DNA helicase RecQ